MKAIEFGWLDLDDATRKIVAHHSMYNPDIIIGVNKTGIIPALMLSNYFDVPMDIMGLRNEDGSVNLRELTRISSRYDGKRIILVDAMINSDDEVEYIRSYTNAVVTSLVTRSLDVKKNNFFSPQYIAKRNINFIWE